MRNLNNSQGFSLIELMIVVGIIGILAGLVGPNFQVFLRKSKQSEAKTNLGIIYTAQKSFFGEWTFYHGGFEHIGFVPEGELTYRYGTALYKGNSLASYNTIKGTIINNSFGNSRWSTGYCTLHGGCTHDPGTIAQTSTKLEANNTDFLSAAAADLGGESKDEWSINEQKSLVQQLAGD